MPLAAVRSGHPKFSKLMNEDYRFFKKPFSPPPSPQHQSMNFLHYRTFAASPVLARHSPVGQLPAGGVGTAAESRPAGGALATFKPATVVTGLVGAAGLGAGGEPPPPPLVTAARGFGFAVFAEGELNMSLAMRLNGRMLRGRRLQVNRHHPSSSSSTPVDGSSRGRGKPMDGKPGRGRGRGGGRGAGRSAKQL